jgi:methyltransferase-like protein
MTNYEKSNSIETLPRLNKIKFGTKRMFQKFREERTISQPMLQMMSDNICNDLNVPEIKVKFHGNQPKQKRGKTLGIFVRKGLSQYIQVYQYTATHKKQVSNKGALDTLLHELNHYFDLNFVGLTDTIHSKGFFMRISSLKNELMS